MCHHIICFMQTSAFQSVSCYETWSNAKFYINCISFLYFIMEKVMTFDGFGAVFFFSSVLFYKKKWPCFFYLALYFMFLFSIRELKLLKRIVLVIDNNLRK